MRDKQIIHDILFIALFIKPRPLSVRVVGRTHGAPCRGYGYVPLRFGGTSFGE